MKTLLTFLVGVAHAQSNPYQRYCDALGNQYCGSGTAFLAEIAGRVAGIVGMLAGGTAILAFIYGGILVIASGLEDKKAEGKKLMISAVVGLILAGMAFGLVEYTCMIIDESVGGGGQLECGII